MDNIYEDIRKYSGVEDIEYLEEGIMFFKNSSKIKRLAKKLIQKHATLIKKGKSSEASALNVLIKETEKIGNKFEEVEREFRSTKDKDSKKKIKAKYESLEKDFKKLIDIANQESVKRALIATGTAALIVGVLAAGVFGFISLKNTGVLANVESNIGARVQLRDLKAQNIPSASDTPLDQITKMGTRTLSGALLTNTIKKTNQDLVTTASLAGATAAGVLSASVIGDLRKMSQNDKTIANTLRVIENIKSAEKKGNISSGNEGDEIDDE